ncbi:MAG TPA: DUF2298 domain-containing protein, partial [Dehalococcoidia bacterium]|nr:DUF2298 domain-containing protein [Dehalococcoidia bacterium]
MPLFAFWLASIALWVMALPLTARVFRRFPDAGAGLAFPFGLVLVGYAYFLLRVAGVLERGRGGYVIAAGLILLFGLWAIGRDPRILPTLRRARFGILASLMVFSIVFCGFALYRSYLPGIWQTEQPMDVMYLNATITSEAYPPHDPWLAGEEASYYYFGYLQAGVLTELGGVSSTTGYNLALAWTFGASAVAIASVAAALARWALGGGRQHWPVVASGAAILLLLGAGSLAGVFELTAAHEQYDREIYEAVGLETLLPCHEGETSDCYLGPSPRTTAWYPTEFWFWFRDTRIIPGTIIEFPVFSFLLGDLHPHLMAIPLVILATGVAAVAWRSRRQATAAWHLKDPTTTVVLAIIFGALAFQNAWDLLTFSGLFAVAVAAGSIRTRGPTALLGVIGYLVPLFILATLLYLPWYRTFSSQAEGLYAFTGEGTKPAHAFLQFGTLLIASAAMLTWAIPSWRRLTSPVTLAAGATVVVVPLVAWVAWTLRFWEAGGNWVPDHLNAAFSERGDGGWVTLALYSLLTAALTSAALAGALRRHGAAPVLALAGGGILLLLGTELFLIRDIFFGSLPRMNTAFKLSYQAWIILSIAGGVGLVGAARASFSTRQAAPRLALSAGTLLLASSLVYPIIAIPNRTGGFDASRSLDGLSALARANPEEFALVKWIGESVEHDAIVVEASGRAWARGEDGALVITNGRVDYTYASRVSSWTGRQTPIGWHDHEVQWRGAGIRTELGRRQDLVDTVYIAADASTSLEALRQLDADYVVVGTIERNR